LATALRLGSAVHSSYPGTSPSGELEGNPDWCGCSTEYLPVPASDGWWSLVPIWEPDVTPNPLRRWDPPVPYWARDP